MHHAHTSPPAINSAWAWRRFAGVDITLTRNVRTTQSAGTLAPPKLTPASITPTYDTQPHHRKLRDGVLEPTEPRRPLLDGGRDALGAVLGHEEHRHCLELERRVERDRRTVVGGRSRARSLRSTRSPRTSLR